jgi:WD40 repeat protein
MGEVYRARDTRLGREVAIKILPASFAADPDRLRRFEQEARATGSLNHPNILVVYDFGTHGAVPYVVEELLEGSTLHERMAGGALPVRKALDYARQTAQGLAAAHAKGIVHRDLKPENLFATHDGRVKILDFGLAKVTRPEEASAPGGAAATGLTAMPTRTGTAAGVILGTVGYMSPEMVRGQATDQRSDIFTFGSILYEMLAGRRAFSGPSSVETMNAILKEEPPEISRTHHDLPPGLERIVHHCLEKNPEERFQSARDLAFQLEALSSVSAQTASGTGGSVEVRRRTTARGGVRVPLWATLAAVAVAAGAAWFTAGALRPADGEVTYSQLTFRQGIITSAKFTPDGGSVIYAASWDGAPSELFSARPGSPESRPLGVVSNDVLSISRSGEMAILLDERIIQGWMRTGTLARAPLAGGVPRRILDDVQDADWSADDQDLAVAHRVGGKFHLEYPIGKSLYETEAWISSVRLSRDGKRIAFVDHPSIGDNRGRIGLVDLAGRTAFLTKEFSAVGLLAWSPAGDEIWFSAGSVGNLRNLHAVTPSGKQRVVDGAPTDLDLGDVSAAGRALVIRNTARRGIIGKPPGGDAEHDLSWLDWSRPGALSPDGQWLLFEEQGQGGGPNYSVYLRKTDGSPAVRLGDGYAASLSDDGGWALTGSITSSDTLMIVPRGAGQSRTLRLPGLSLNGAEWLRDGRRMILNASLRGGPYQNFLLDSEAGTPRPITPPGAEYWGASSPDDRVFASGPIGQPLLLYPIEGGGDPRPVPGSLPGDIARAWSSDGRALYVAVSTPPGARIDRIDVATGKRTLVKDLMPNDRAGLIDLSQFQIAPDARAYVYSYRRILSTLYDVDGLR